MVKLHVVFSHGQESGPWGTKITAMAEVAKELRATVESIDYQGIADPHERVKKLIDSQRDQKRKTVFVGSSMGGHVAAAAALVLNPAGLFVLAPAFHVPGFEELTPIPAPCPCAIVHGWRDDVVPMEGVIRYARDALAELHLIDGDHRLTDNLETINFLFRDFLKRIAG